MRQLPQQPQTCPIRRSLLRVRPSSEMALLRNRHEHSPLQSVAPPSFQMVSFRRAQLEVSFRRVSSLQHGARLEEPLLKVSSLRRDLVHDELKLEHAWLMLPSQADALRLGLSSFRMASQREPAQHARAHRQLSEMRVTFLFLPYPLVYVPMLVPASSLIYVELLQA